MPTRTTVGVATVQLFTDDVEMAKYSDQLLRDVIHKESIPNGGVRFHLNQFTTRMDRYYEYGRDHFVNGLPTGYGLDTIYINTSAQTISNTLVDILGEPIQLLTYTVDELADPVSEAHFHMAHYHGYVPSTGIINSTSIGKPATDVIVYTSSSFELYDPEIDLDIDGSTGQVLLQINYSKDNGDDTFTPIHTERVPMRWYTEGAPVIKATYRLTGDPTNEVYTWVYAVNSHEFPDLGSVVLSDQELLSYFPIVPIRENKQFIHEQREPYGIDHHLDTGGSGNENLEENEGVILPDVEVVLPPYSELNQSCRDLLEVIGLSLPQLSSSIAESPDIDDVDDAYLMNIVPINAGSKEEREYLWRYFVLMHATQTSTRDQWNAWENNPVGAPPITRIQWRDKRAAETEYEQSIRFNYIEMNLNKVGVMTTEGDYRTIGIPNNSTRTINGAYIRDDQLIYRYQKSATHYDEIIIHGIYQVGSIWVDVKRSKMLHSETTVGDAFAADDERIDGLYVPLCRNILDDMDNLTQQILVRKSFHIVINTIVKTKIKWYQTEAFRILIYIIAIIVAIYTQNPEATTTVLGLLQAVVVQVVVNLAISYVIDQILMDALIWLVKTLGLETSIILAVIIAAIALSSGNAEIMQFADQLLLATNAVFKAVAIAVKDEFLELQEDYEEFLESAEETQERLDKEMDELSSQLEAYELVRRSPSMSELETPEQFIHRTIHLGNPGVLSLEMAENFVGNLLKLPTQDFS